MTSADASAHHLALKVRAEWLEKLRSGAKSAELRAYPPEKHVKKELVPLLEKRIFLVHDGEVWGSCRIQKVVSLKTEKEKLQAYQQHRVPKKNVLFQKATHMWELTDFRWFNSSDRPACDRPSFLGRYLEQGKKGKGQIFMR